MTQPVLYALISVALLNVLSLAGALTLTFHARFVSRAILFLVSFSTGAILGTVFFHLLPESMEHAEDPVVGSSLILVGLFLAFAIEKFIHWHHCHNTEHEEESGRHTHPVGSLIIIGDGIHNFIDGMLIASAYLISVPVGVATTIAVVLHELPQELGDVSLLLHSGFSRARAIFWNTISSCTALLGCLVAIFFSESVDGIEFILLPIAAGNFLYIATADLIPELHKETRLLRTFAQVFLILAGILLMMVLSVSAGHEQEEGHESPHAEDGAHLLDEHAHE